MGPFDRLRAFSRQFLWDTDLHRYLFGQLRIDCGIAHGEKAESIGQSFTARNAEKVGKARNEIASLNLVSFLA
jgi:hypothetical protein